jgi:HK97 family phage major capsid protein
MAGVDRTAAASLFEELVAPNVVQQMTRQSVALQTLPVISMGNQTTRIPVLAALPTAAFLNADQAEKPQSSVAWDNKLLTAEEIAVIVPISETVLADATINVTENVTRLIGQELGRVLDSAVFFGTGAPATYPTGGIFGTANTAGQTVVATDDPAVDMNLLFGQLEALAFDPTNVYAGRAYKSSLRGQVSTTNVPVYLPEQGAGSFGSIYGVPLSYPMGWDGTKADALAVDRMGAMIGLRQDVSIKILEEASLTGFGNLAEKDSIAVRAVMRVGFQIANPVTVETGEQQYPVAALTPKPDVRRAKA